MVIQPQKKGGQVSIGEMVGKSKFSLSMPLKGVRRIPQQDVVRTIITTNFACCVAAHFMTDIFLE